MIKNKQACLVCGKELHYTQTAQEMECVFCHQKFMSNACCEDGHYVCDECHAQKGIEVIMTYCGQTTSKNPIYIAQEIMKNPYIYMHGPEHHVLVGAALLAAYKNAGGHIDFPAALQAMKQRGTQVPGGVCGLWGACGAGISTGIFISIITGSTPLKKEEWRLSNFMTSTSLQAIGEKGGPRCCKRDSFTAIVEAVKFCADHFKVQLELPGQITCEFYPNNAQCLGHKCPYHPVNA